MKRTLLVGLMLSLSLGAWADESPITLGKTPDGIEYGLWGHDDATSPSPTLFVLSGTIDGTLSSPYFRQSGNELEKKGYRCVSIDIPCHGALTGAGKPSGLGGWRLLVTRDEDFVAQNNQRLSAVLDHLIATGVTDPDRVAICGTSRGGFLAIHFAAHDPRVKCAAAFAPVTDLAALSEFRGAGEHPMTERLSLENQADKLAGRPIWIVIGDQDERVGTQKAVDLANRITEASKQKKLTNHLQLLVKPEPRGHTTPKGSSTLAAEWIDRQIANPDAAP